MNLIERVERGMTTAEDAETVRLLESALVDALSDLAFAESHGANFRASIIKGEVVLRKLEGSDES